MLRRVLAPTLLLVLFTASMASAQSAVRWQSDIDRARLIARESNRLVLIHFWGNNCKPCLLLERNVFVQPQFAAALEADYVPVKINASEFPVTARQYQIEFVPTDVIVTPDGKVVRKASCPQDAAEYSQSLRQVAATYRQANAQFAQADRSAEPRDATRTTQTTFAPRDEADRAPANSDARAASPDRRYADPSASAPETTRAAASPVVDRRAIASNDLPYSAQGSNAPADAGPNLTTPSSPAPGLAPPEVNAPPHNVAPRNATQPPAAARPADSQPTLCLDGFCPVTLIESQKWVAGDRRFGAVHRGRIYLFASEAAQQRFFADPDRFAPTVSGNDAVEWLDRGRFVPGARKFGGYYRNYIYLFSSNETLKQFEANPERYATAVEQALTAERQQARR